MPTLAGSVIALAVVAAVPTVKQPWFEFHDYPMKAFERHAEGVTRFNLLVAPDGHVADCTVTQSSGDQDLDRTTCSLAAFRARFQPAVGPDRQPIYGLYRSQAVWTIPTDTLEGVVHDQGPHLGNYQPGPDLDVSVNKRPQGTNQPPVVKLAYAEDTQCNPSS
jgi:TonB family protein